MSGTGLLSEKEIQLVFCDKFTFDLVETPENIQVPERNRIKRFVAIMWI